jgi:hypothetical protein
MALGLEDSTVEEHTRVAVMLHPMVHVYRRMSARNPIAATRAARFFSEHTRAQLAPACRAIQPADFKIRARVVSVNLVPRTPAARNNLRAARHRAVSHQRPG